MEWFKCVVVGEAAAGKTSLIHTYMSGFFPGYIPNNIITRYEVNYVCKLSDLVKAEPGLKNLKSEANHLNFYFKIYEYDLDKSDALQFIKENELDDVDVIILCYRKQSQRDLIDLKNRINLRWPTNTPPIVLVSCFADLTKTPQPFQSNHHQQQQQEQDQILIDKINAKLFFNCSALQHSNIDKLFDETFKIAIVNKLKTKTQSQQNLYYEEIDDDLAINDQKNRQNEPEISTIKLENVENENVSTKINKNKTISGGVDNYEEIIQHPIITHNNNNNNNKQSVAETSQILENENLYTGIKENVKPAEKIQEETHDLIIEKEQPHHHNPHNQQQQQQQHQLEQQLETLVSSQHQLNIVENEKLFTGLKKTTKIEGKNHEQQQDAYSKSVLKDLTKEKTLRIETDNIQIISSNLNDVEKNAASIIYEVNEVLTTDTHVTNMKKQLETIQKQHQQQQQQESAMNCRIRNIQSECSLPSLSSAQSEKHIITYQTSSSLVSDLNKRIDDKEANNETDPLLIDHNKFLTKSSSLKTNSSTNCLAKLFFIISILCIMFYFVTRKYCLNNKQHCEELYDLSLEVIDDSINTFNQSYGHLFKNLNRLKIFIKN